MKPIQSIAGLLAGLCALALCLPAQAHHGKDFLLLETDDMPEKGHVYGIVSVDTLRDNEGARTTEITPGLLLGTDRWAFEPHFHLARTRGTGASDDGFHYDATAFGVRYRVGNIGRSEWRLAVSAEVEKPKESDEPYGLEPRVILVRTLPNALVAINVIGERELTGGAEWEKAIGLGILKPLPNGNRVGLEIVASLPLRDGVEIMPGYYMQFGKTGNTALKVGVGYFHATGVNSGTLHVQLTRRF